MSEVETVEIAGTKRLAEEDIDMLSLGDSQVYIRVPLSKKLLAEKSPVFQRQFCGPLSKTTSNEEPEHLDLGEFSPEACREFMSYFLDKNHSYSGQDIELVLELCLLADKYQMKELTADLVKVVDKFPIGEEDVFKYVDLALQKKDLPPLEKVCNMIIRNCAEVVHLKQINLLQLWTQYGHENGKLLSVLNTETQKLEGARSRSIATLTLKLEKVSEKIGTVSSPHCIIRNTPWRFAVTRQIGRQQAAYLRIGLTCGILMKGGHWSVKAKAKFYLVNQDEGGRYLAHEIDGVFSNNQIEVGVDNYLAGYLVTDPTYGYVKDDTAYIEAEVEAEVPQGVSWDSKKLSENELCNNCLSNPCLDGQLADRLWEGLQVTKIQSYGGAVRRVSKDDEGDGNTKTFTQDGDRVFLQFQEVSASVNASSWRYRCK